ncbi:MAG: site-specific integrase, partial [Bacteroidales bacterium]|nr:site-specific integrase [Bacteroidales bacterium]
MKPLPGKDQEWTDHVNDFMIYLRLERSLSDNTRKAYLGDVCRFLNHLVKNTAAGSSVVRPGNIKGKDIESFLKEIADSSASPRTQARMLSGL